MYAAILNHPDAEGADTSGLRTCVSGGSAMPEAVMDAVRQSRFAPAQTPVGRAVAVNMVWLIVVTTVQQPSVPQVHVPASPVVARTRRLPPTDAVTPTVPVGRQSARLSASPTA